MWRVIAPIFLILFVSAPASAATMNGGRPCRVVAGEKFLAGSGGANALCSEIHRAVSTAAPKVRYTADVKALSASRLSAALTVNGAELPEQHFGVMDHSLDASSIREFARSVAEEVARAAKR